MSSICLSSQICFLPVFPLFSSLWMLTHMDHINRFLCPPVSTYVRWNLEGVQREGEQGGGRNDSSASSLKNCHRPQTSTPDTAGPGGLLHCIPNEYLFNISFFSHSSQSSGRVMTSVSFCATLASILWPSASSVKQNKTSNFTILLRIGPHTVFTGPPDFCSYLPKIWDN